MKWLLVMMIFDPNSLQQHEHAGERVMRLTKAYDSEEACWKAEGELNTMAREMNSIVTCISESEFRK